MPAALEQQHRQLVAWLQQQELQPVVDFDPAADRLQALDFTEANTALTAPVLEHTALFCGYINRQLAQTGARYGIGGYNEHRTVYSRSRVFDATEAGSEPRRLHLGTDIWGPAGTPVFAPLPAIVHSTAFNDHYGDYGATIILQHQAPGLVFYSLYGHMNLAALQLLQEGEPVTAGRQIACLGVPEENGHWPPHLHFQLIIDLEGNRGDYPGVCAASKKQHYLCNCPDPDHVLRLNRYL